MKKIIWLLLVIVFTGCTSSQITSSWKASNVYPKKYDKVLVLGLIGEPDRTIQEKMEQHLAGDLIALGYNAVTSIQEYGPKTFENMKEAEAINLLYSEGIDAVVTIVLLNKEKERYYTPALAGNHYISGRNHFWEYYSSTFDRVFASGYYAVDTKYYWESNFYDINDWKLLYSVQSQSFDSKSTNMLSHEYGEMIVKDMVKSNVVQQQKGVLKSF